MSKATLLLIAAVLSSTAWHSLALRDAPGRGGQVVGQVVGEPFTVDELTAEVLDDILHREQVLPDDVHVLAVEKTRFGVGDGMLSSLYRLVPDYGANADPMLPKTLVAKFGPQTPEAIFLGELLDLFETEVNWFLNGMPNASGIPAPKVYHAAYGGNGLVVLIMEDMWPAKVMDQFVGASADQTASAVKALAKMHAMYRGRVHEADETKDWVRPANDVAFNNLLRSSFEGTTKGLTDERYMAFGLKKSETENLQGAIAYLNENYDAYLQDVLNNHQPASEHSQFVTTLIHGDFRAANIFPSAGRDGGIKLIDFQIVREAVGSEDLSYFLTCSLTTEQRREVEVKMLRLYFDEMKRNGASDFTMEELLLSYQRALAVSLIGFVVGSTGDAQGILDLMGLMGRRINAALVDWKWVESTKLRSSKQGADGVTSKYSPEELRQSLPSFTHGLLEL